MSNIDAGCTVPCSIGHGARASCGSPSCRRLLTTAPWIGSAGCDAYHDTTFVVSLLCERMFQIAFTLREVLALTRRPLASGFGSTKLRMPCLSAVFPVAIEVHSSGESLGSSVVRSARTPRSTNARRCGIPPALKRRSMMSQSAASQPRNRILRTGRSTMGGSYRMQ